MLTTNDNCRSDLISAYIDGDLEQEARAALEFHVSECNSCKQELQMQQLFLCELDSAFATESDLPVPPDFARIVAAQAESDMRGARSGVEHKRALKFCIVLAIASFILLGSAASKSLLSSMGPIVSKILGLGGLAGKTLYDVGVGLTVILRATGRAFSLDSLSVLVFLILLLAVLLLSLLISSYHRTQRRRLYE